VDITEQIKPISYLKNHASEIAKGFEDGNDSPIIITQNGDAKMVVISIKSYQESIEQRKVGAQRIAFLKLLALGGKEIEGGKFVTEEDFLDGIDKD
jgi:prevent-host-death family protein